MISVFTPFVASSKRLRLNSIFCLSINGDLKMNSEFENELTEQANQLTTKVSQYMQEFGEPVESFDQIFDSNITIKKTAKAVLIGVFRDSNKLMPGAGRAFADIVELILSDLPALGLNYPLDQISPHPNGKRNYLWTSSNSYSAEYEQHALSYCSDFNEIDCAVQGSVEAEGSCVKLTIEWLDVQGNEVSERKTLTSEGSDCYSTVLSAAISWILEQLEILLSQQEIQILNSWLPEGEIRTYIELMCQLDGSSWSDASSTIKLNFEDVKLPSMAYLIMYLEPSGFDSSKKMYARYELLEKKWNSHSWLLVQQAIKYQENNSFDLDREAARRLFYVLKKRPGNIRIIHAIVMMLLLCEQYVRAISFAFELLRLRPEHFESWWTVSYALTETAWDYRGHDWWSNVTKSHQDVFEDLSEMSVEALNRAMQIQPDSPRLIEDRIRLFHGASDDIWDLLNESVAIDPSYSGSFDAALNFTQPRWCGWLNYQMYIVNLAFKHNPKEKWPLEFYKEYVELNSDYSFFTRLKLVFKRLFVKNWPESILEKD